MALHHYTHEGPILFTTYIYARTANLDMAECMSKLKELGRGLLWETETPVPKNMQLQFWLRDHSSVSSNLFKESFQVLTIAVNTYLS